MIMTRQDARKKLMASVQATDSLRFAELVTSSQVYVIPQATINLSSFDYYCLCYKFEYMLVLALCLRPHKKKLFLVWRFFKI